MVQLHYRDREVGLSSVLKLGAQDFMFEIFPTERALIDLHFTAMNIAGVADLAKMSFNHFRYGRQYLP